MAYTGHLPAQVSWGRRMWGGSCCAMSPSPGPGHVPIWHGWQSLDLGLLREQCVSGALPRLAREAVLAEGLESPWGRGGGGQARGSLLPPLPHPGSHHPRRVEPKGVLSPPALMPCPICPLVHPLKQSLASPHVQGRGAHFFSRPKPIWGQKACPSAGAATALWPPSLAQTVFAFWPCLKHP